MASSSFNPGKNVKGQAFRSRKHHTGHIPIQYVEDPGARANCLSKRMKTLEEKMKELSVMTNTQIMLKYKTTSGRERTIKAENWTEKDTTDATSAASTQRSFTDELQAVYPAPPEPAPQPVTEPASWKRFRLVEESAPEDRCRICNQESMRRGKADICIQCEHSSHLGTFCVRRVSGKQRKRFRFYCPIHIKAFQQLCKFRLHFPIMAFIND